MSRKKKYTLRLSFDGNNLMVETLDTRRISHHGFGTYLIKYRPKEILITKKAKKALMKCRELHGAKGMEFFSSKTLSWGVGSPNASIPIDLISVPECAKSFIDKFDVED